MTWASRKSALEPSTRKGVIIAKSDSFSIEDYDLQEYAEGLLFDRVSYKNRIESGSLHLCTAGIGFSFSPFASVL